MKQAFLAVALIFGQLTETIEVSIVNLDVIVTDRQGNRVRGLQPSDFEVRENGKLQTITNFAEYGDPRLEAVEGTGTGDPPSRDRLPQDPRTIIIFIERVQLLPPDADRLFASLEEMITKVVRPRDAVSVVWWDRTLTVKQDFTDDVPVLLKTIRELREETKKVMPRDSMSMAARQQEQDEFAILTAGTGMAPPDTMASESAMLASRAFMQTKAKTYALKSLVDVMAPAKGKKILLMATRRYSEFAGAEFFEGGTMPQLEQRQYNTLALRKSLTDSANAAGVTIYAVYPPGMAKGTSMSAETAPYMQFMTPEREAQNAAFDHNVLMNESQALEDLARATGGLSAWGAGSIVEMMPRLADDIQSYYSVAFRATPGLKKERRVEVRTVNRDYQVRARRSYVEKNETERMADRVAAQLFLPIAPNTLAVSAQLGEPGQRGRKIAIPLKVRVPIGKLTTLPEGRHHAGAFTVFAAAGGRVGVVSEVSQKTQSFRITLEDLDRARASHYRYEITVMTDGKADYVAVGVLDEVSKEFGIVRLPLPR